MVKKIVLGFISLLLVLFLVVLGWFYFYVLPNPDRMPDPSRIQVTKKDGYRKLYSRLFNEPDKISITSNKVESDSAKAVFQKYPTQRQDHFINPFGEKNIYDVALGKILWEQEVHKSLLVNTNSEIIWETAIPDSSELILHLATLSDFENYKGSPVRFVIKADEKFLADTIVIPQYELEHDEKSDEYELFGQFIYVQHVKKGGYWATLKLNLDGLKNEKGKIRISVSGNPNVPALLGNPEIWTHSKSKNNKRKNVIILQVDSLNPDALSINGNPFSTPVFDSLITSGTYFENAISQFVWTRPSIHSMLMSQYPKDLMEFTFFETIAYNTPRIVRSNYQSVYQLLKKEGYYTASIANNLFLTNAVRIGIEMGFDDHFDIQRDFYDAMIITEKAINFIQENQDRDFALFLNYNNPHFTFKPPHKYNKNGFWDVLTNNNENLFHGEIAYTEDCVQKFLQKFKELGLDENTIIVLNADHGVLIPDYPDHMRYEKINTFSGTIDENRMHIPLLFSGPGIPKNTRVSGQVELVDVSPTIMSLLGFHSPDYFMGKNLVPMIENPKLEGKEYAYEFARELRAVRWKNKWKFLQSNLEKYNIRELYDLEIDPAEKHNIVLDRPDIAEHLSKKLDEMYLKRPVIIEMNAINMDSTAVKKYRITSTKPVYKLYDYHAMLLDTIVTLKGSTYSSIPFEIAYDSTFQVQVTDLETGSKMPIHWSEGILLGSDHVNIDYALMRQLLTYKRTIQPKAGIYIQFVPNEYWHRGGLNEALATSSVKEVMKSWGYIR